jgi:3-hydroxyacyl-CoA dehydrogenase
MIFMMAVEQEYDELNMAIKTFQDTMMRVRYSSIPVVASRNDFGGCRNEFMLTKLLQQQKPIWV